MTIPTNVILFGETGSGKSSLVNMLSGKDVTSVSSGMDGRTLESTPYQVDILGRPMIVWDTAGLNEGETGRMPDWKAIANLYSLLRKVETGINLLVFVTRPRIKDSASKNWKLFHEIICQKEVPIVIVVTGLEEENDMEKWWKDNKEKLQRYGIYPDDHACITTSRGKARRGGHRGHIYDEEFEESKEKVLFLLKSKCANTAWRVQRAEWFKQIVDNTRKAWFFEICPLRNKDGGEALRQLIKDCKMSSEEANHLARKLNNVDQLL